MDFTFMQEAFLRLISGVPLTLNLAFTSIAFGAVLAMLLALMRMSGIRILDWVAQAYVFVFRGTPLLVQLIFWYNLSTAARSFAAACSRFPTSRWRPRGLAACRAFFSSAASSFRSRCDRLCPPMAARSS